MRCATARKRISDARDGRLSAGRKTRLDVHLEGCPACRSYRSDLDLIQGAAAPPPRPADDFWAAFERRLEARLDAASPSPAGSGAPVAARRRWAWAAAAVTVLAGVALWLALPRKGLAPAEAWLAADDILEPLVQAAETDPELAGRIEREIQASIEEASPALEAGEETLPPANDPLYWESLTEDDLRAVVAALEKETGLGGPK
jgi:anti-sigma factor RsiW